MHLREKNHFLVLRGFKTAFMMEALSNFPSSDLLCRVRNPWLFLPCCLLSRGLLQSSKPNILSSLIFPSSTRRHFLTGIDVLVFYHVLFNIFQPCLTGFLIRTPFLLYKAKKKLPRNPTHFASKITDHFCVLTGVKQALETQI